MWRGGIYLHPVSTKVWKTLHIFKSVFLVQGDLHFLQTGEGNLNKSIKIPKVQIEGPAEIWSPPPSLPKLGQSSLSRTTARVNREIDPIDVRETCQESCYLGSLTHFLLLNMGWVSKYWYSLVIHWYGFIDFKETLL